MKIKKYFTQKIDWYSKFIDLLIVVIGISIAFQLNTWNESRRSELEVKAYIKSFSVENILNEKKLVSSLDFLESQKTEIDTLNQIILSKRYSDKRIKALSAKLLSYTSFLPSETTMENIISSGEFGLINNIELRKQIIDTYSSFKTSLKFEKVLSDYMDSYITPFYFENMKFSDFSPLDSELNKNPLFENIILGYSVLIDQQIRGYEYALNEIKKLNKILTSTINIENIE